MNEHNTSAPGDVVVAALCFAVLFFVALPDLFLWLYGLRP